MNRIQNGDTERLSATALDSTGAFIIGLSDMLVEITRQSDDFYLDFNDNTFKSSGWTTRQQIMSELDATNSAGTYYYDFNTTGFNDDVYFLRSTSATAINDPFENELKVGGSDDSLVVMSAVWNALLTGMTFNIQNSAGKRLRVIQEAGGYEHGAVWVDTVDGTAGTDPFDRGTITSKVLTFADAILIADNPALNLKRFEFSSDSAITLAAALTNRVLSGHGWNLALGGRDISDTHFIDAEVSGVGTGSNAEFHDSELSSVTTGPGELHNCAIEGTFTCGAAGQYHFHNCHAGDHGVTTTIDAIVGDVILLIHGWQGAYELQNLGVGGTDIVNSAGDGEITINANCVGGIINLQGNWKITDNSGSVTIIKDDNSTNIDGPITIGSQDTENGIETGYTERQVNRLMAAALAGKLSGAATTTVTIRDITDTKDRITATVDADGNRTAITLDAT